MAYLSVLRLTGGVSLAEPSAGDRSHPLLHSRNPDPYHRHRQGMCRLAPPSVSPSDVPTRERTGPLTLPSHRAARDHDEADSVHEERSARLHIQGMTKPPPLVRCLALRSIRLVTHSFTSSSFRPLQPPRSDELLTKIETQLRLVDSIRLEAEGNILRRILPEASRSPF